MDTDEHRCPLTRPRDCGTTLSPIGERERVRGSFMEREHLQNPDVSCGHEPLLVSPLPALSPQGGERVAEGRERGGSWRDFPETKLRALNP